MCQFFITMCTYNSYSFLFIHLRDHLGVATAEIGLQAALLGASEIPFLYLMDAILPRVRIRVAYIASIVGILLFTIALGQVTSLPLLVLLFVFRGFFWPGFHLSSFRLVNAISHPRNVATNQALIQVTVPSISLLLTGSFFGWTYDNLGTGAFFGLCALACAIGCVIFISGYRQFDMRNSIEHA